MSQLWDVTGKLKTLPEARPIVHPFPVREALETRVFRGKHCPPLASIPDSISPGVGSNRMKLRARGGAHAWWAGAKVCP